MLQNRPPPTWWRWLGRGISCALHRVCVPTFILTPGKSDVTPCCPLLDQSGIDKRRVCRRRLPLGLLRVMCGHRGGGLHRRELMVHARQVQWRTGWVSSPGQEHSVYGSARVIKGYRSGPDSLGPGANDRHPVGSARRERTGWPEPRVERKHKPELEKMWVDATFNARVWSRLRLHRSRSDGASKATLGSGTLPPMARFAGMTLGELYRRRHCEPSLS